MTAVSKEIQQLRRDANADGYAAFRAGKPRVAPAHYGSFDKFWLSGWRAAQRRYDELKNISHTGAFKP